MSGILCSSPVLTMFDSSKGSITNRYDCAKEHFKNNFKTTAEVALVAGGAGLLAAKKPKVVIVAGTKIASACGKFISKSPKALDLFRKAASKFRGVKLNRLGLLVAAGAALGIILKGVFKSGQIDQKYTDSAKIESETKNIVLEKPRKCTPEDIREYYENGGRGIYA